MDYQYKLTKNQKIKELLKDLAHFNRLWREALYCKHDFETAEFLIEMANTTLRLQRHANACKSLFLWEEGASLIVYLLTSTMGAPFVSITSLFEAADQFLDQQPEKSSLKILLTQFIRCQRQISVPYLKNFKQLEIELTHYYRETPLDFFSIAA